MCHRHLSLAFLLATPCALALGQASSRPKSESLPRVSALWNDLAQSMSVEPFLRRIRLKDALEILQKQFRQRHGRELPILINERAFKDENPEAPDLHEAFTELRPHPRVRTTGQLLRDLLAHIPAGNATYLLQPGVVEITTFSDANPAQRLCQTVELKFSRQPLSFVLEEIYERTGVHVILDPRVGVNARAQVTITFTNDLALGTGLVLIAEMAQLRLVETDNAVFITTPAIAQRFWWERGGGRYVPPTYTPHRREAAALPLPIPIGAGQ